MALRFDESLHEFAAALSDEFGIAAVQDGRIIRDAFGRLTFISKVELEEATLKAATKHLIERMEPYVDPERVILTPDYPGMSDILTAEGLQIQTVAADGTVFSIHLLDRRNRRIRLADETFRSEIECAHDGICEPKRRCWQIDGDLRPGQAPVDPRKKCTNS